MAGAYNYWHTTDIIFWAWGRAAAYGLWSTSRDITSQYSQPRTTLSFFENNSAAEPKKYINWKIPGIHEIWNNQNPYPLLMSVSRTTLENQEPLQKPDICRPGACISSPTERHVVAASSTTAPNKCTQKPSDRTRHKPSGSSFAAEHYLATRMIELQLHR